MTIQSIRSMGETGFTDISHAVMQELCEISIPANDYFNESGSDEYDYGNLFTRENLLENHYLTALDNNNADAVFFRGIDQFLRENDGRYDGMIAVRENEASAAPLVYDAVMDKVITYAELVDRIEKVFPAQMHLDKERLASDLFKEVSGYENGLINISIRVSEQEYTLTTYVEGIMSRDNYDMGCDTHGMKVKWDNANQTYRLGSTFKTAVVAESESDAVQKANDKFKHIDFEGFSAIKHGEFKVVDIRSALDINPYQLDIAEVDSGTEYIQECFTVLDENGMHVEIALASSYAELQKIVDRTMKGTRFEQSESMPNIFLHVTKESLKMFLSVGVQENGLLSFKKNEVPLSTNEVKELTAFVEKKVNGINELLSNSKVRSTALPIESLWVHTETENGIQRQSAFVKEVYELPAYVDIEMDCPEKDIETFIARAGGMLTEKNNRLHAVALTKDIVYLEFQGTKGETTQIPLKQSEQKALVQKISKEVKGFTFLLNQAAQREDEQIAAIEKEAEKFNRE